jgi:hypothetical protein
LSTRITLSSKPDRRYKVVKRMETLGLTVDWQEHAKEAQKSFGSSNKNIPKRARPAPEDIYAVTPAEAAAQVSDWATPNYQFITASLKTRFNQIYHNFENRMFTMHPNSAKYTEKKNRWYNVAPDSAGEPVMLTSEEYYTHILNWCSMTKTLNRGDASELYISLESAFLLRCYIHLFFRWRAKNLKYPKPKLLMNEEHIRIITRLAVLVCCLQRRLHTHKTDKTDKTGKTDKTDKTLTNSAVEVRSCEE